MTTTALAIAAVLAGLAVLHWALGRLERHLSPRRTRVRAAAKAENEAIRRASATLWGAGK